MERFSTISRWVAVGVMGALLAGGCASSTGSLSPQDKARFGYVGMPKPPEAQKFMMQQHTTGVPPAQPTKR